MIEVCTLLGLPQRGRFVRAAREHREQHGRAPLEGAEWRLREPITQRGMKRPRVERGIERPRTSDAKPGAHAGQGSVEQVEKRRIAAPRRHRRSADDPSHQPSAERVQGSRGGGSQSGTHERTDRRHRPGQAAVRGGRVTRERAQMVVDRSEVLDDRSVLPTNCEDLGDHSSIRLPPQRDHRPPRALNGRTTRCTRPLREDETLAGGEGTADDSCSAGNARRRHAVSQLGAEFLP